MSNKVSNDEVFFCLSDLSNLILTFKKAILSFACIFASICFFYVMLLPDVYHASAKFSEVPEKKEAINLYKELFSSDSLTEKNKAQEMMQSKLVIVPVVKKLGLQVSCYLKNKNTFLAILQKYFKNVKAELKLASRQDSNFHFSDVSCSIEDAKKYLIFFRSDNNFEIFDMKKRLKKAGKLNEKITLEEVGFTICQVPTSLKKNKAYILNFRSIESCVAKIKKNIKITSSKFSANVLDITYKNFDPFLAQSTLNELMKSYVKYLEKESSLFAQEQFAYLEKRKKQVDQDLKRSLDAHAKYLTDNLLKGGFMGFEQEIVSFTDPYSECLKKAFTLDLELSHIDVLKKNDVDFLFNDELIGKKLEMIGREKSLLNQKKDVLSMSLLSQKKLPDSILFDTTLDNALPGNASKHLLSIANVRKEKNEIEKALDSLKNDTQSDLFSISCLKNFCIPEKSEQLTKKDLNRCLTQVKNALATQEKILEARPIYAQGDEKTFEGLDVDTAKELYISYNHKIDKVQAELKQLQIVLNEIDSAQFEVSAITPFFSDSISLKLMNQASDIQFKLNDVSNISEKDQKRLMDDLFLVKKFLKTYIKQTLQAKKSLENLYKNKLFALQVVTLDQTNQQISILDQQAKDYLFFRKENILKEKVLLQDKMSGIRNGMLSLPNKWKQEKLLMLKSEVALKVIQSLTNLIESKTIDYHLKQIASKPIEMAEFPKSPKSKRGFFVFVLAFCIGCVISIFYFFIRAMNSGFIATLDNLAAIGEITLGEISFACDGPRIEYIQDNDLETLRNIIQFSEPLLKKSGSILSVIGNNGPNYAHSLCDLIGKIGKKALLLELNFQTLCSNKNGLLQYLDKKIKDIPIQELNNYDFLSTGATSRFGTEILRSLSFNEFIKEIKGKYDIIIAYSKAGPISAEAKTYLQFSNKLVVSFINETVQMLSTFYQKEKEVGFLKVKP